MYYLMYYLIVYSEVRIVIVLLIICGLSSKPVWSYFFHLYDMNGRVYETP